MPLQVLRGAGQTTLDTSVGAESNSGPREPAPETVGRHSLPPRGAN